METEIETEVFAVISAKDGKIVVDLGDTANYETVTRTEISLAYGQTIKIEKRGKP